MKLQQQEMCQRSYTLQKPIIIRIMSIQAVALEESCYILTYKLVSNKYDKAKSLKDK